MTPGLLRFVIDLHLEDGEKDEKRREEGDDTNITFFSYLVGSDFIFSFTCSVENSAGPELSLVSETGVITLSCGGSLHSS